MQNTTSVQHVKVKGCCMQPMFTEKKLPWKKQCVGMKKEFLKYDPASVLIIFSS